MSQEAIFDSVSETARVVDEDYRGMSTHGVGNDSMATEATVKYKKSSDLGKGLAKRSHSITKSSGAKRSTQLTVLSMIDQGLLLKVESPKNIPGTYGHVRI